MKRIRTAMDHPLFYTAIAVYFVASAWWRGWWMLGFAGGVFTAMAIDEWADWYFDRWKERYHRERSTREG